MNPYDYKEFLFRKYDIEYNYITKDLYIHKSITVNDFILIKTLTKDYDIKDILVEPRCYTRI